MNRLLYTFLFLSLFPCLVAAQKVISLKIDGAINPVTAGFVHDGIEKAAREKAECLVIRLNTPGGLLQSTRTIVNDILQSPVPVIVYVSPQGAHAGSAGVFLTLAAHIAAMAPVTNIGAAHPVSPSGLDTIMNEKATNDAAAFVRAIAATRNRNIRWAEDAVRYSLSIDDSEALKMHVVDLIVPDETELLKQVDGRQVKTGTTTITLHTKGAAIEVFEMGFFSKILDVISDPNITYIFLLLGLFGALFEFFNPGAILPGIVGGMCLVLSFYSMQALPVNYAGLALIVFGIALFILELKIVSHGMLAAGGIASLLLGSLMLVHRHSDLEFASISRSVIVAATAVSALFFLFVLGLGIKAQRATPVTGVEGLLNQTGESLSLLNPSGRVRIHGEVWNAEAVNGSISAGEKVRVKEIRSLKLYVEAVDAGGL